MTAAARRMPRAGAAPPAGPVALAFGVAFGVVGATLFAWLVGTAIEIVGMQLAWEDEGERHGERLVREDLAYIDAAPRSMLVADPPALARRIVAAVREGYDRLGLVALHERFHGPGAAPLPAAGLQRAAGEYVAELARWVLASMFVLQDTLLRLAIAVFALPAFALACLLGAVDGLVRRDLRRWGGGRESSFVYHHAKRLATWSLTGGFTLYLAWPFGGFNPAYMVLVFTALVAFTLSTALASFKKYV